MFLIDVWNTMFNSYRTLTFLSILFFVVQINNASDAQSWLGFKYDRGIDSELNYYGLTVGFGTDSSWGLGFDFEGASVGEVYIDDSFGYAFYSTDIGSENVFLPYGGFGRTCAEVTTDGESSKSCEAGLVLGGKLILPTAIDISASRLLFTGTASYISNGGDASRLKLGLEVSIGGVD